MEPAWQGGTTLSPASPVSWCRGCCVPERLQPWNTRQGVIQSSFCLPPTWHLTGASGCQCGDGASPGSSPPSLASAHTSGVFELLPVGLSVPAWLTVGRCPCSSALTYVWPQVCLALACVALGLLVPGWVRVPDWATLVWDYLPALLGIAACPGSVFPPSLFFTPLGEARPPSACACIRLGGRRACVCHSALVTGRGGSAARD